MSNGQIHILSTKLQVDKGSQQHIAHLLLYILTAVFGLTNLSAAPMPHYIGHWTPYTTADGLAGGNVSAIIQDRDGAIWIATAGDGVSRFDSESFTTFTVRNGLGSNFVRTVFEDSVGHLWFGTTGGGVSRYDGKTWRTFREADGLVNDFVTAIAEDHNGDLWFGTSRGVSKYRGGKIARNFTHADGLPNKAVWSIARDRHGHLWFGLFGGGVAVYDGVQFRVLTEADGLASSYVYAIAEDKSGMLWFGTYGGVSRYNGVEIVDTLTEAHGLPNRSVFSICRDARDALWLGTNRGVSRFDGIRFQNFDAEDGLVGDRVRTIIEDTAGNLWFGTWGNGICKYNPSIETYINSRGSIAGAFEDPTGDLWFTVSDGSQRLRYDGRSLFRDTTIDTSSTYHIVVGNGGLWFGGRGGLIWYDGNSQKSITDTKWVGSQVEPILQEPAGRLWVEHRSVDASGAAERKLGLGWYDGEEFHDTFDIKFKLQRRRTAHAATSAQIDKRGHIWFSTVDNGVYRYDGAQFTHFTVENGLGGNRISTIGKDRRGNIWIGILGQDAATAGEKSGGLTRYDGNAFRIFSRKDKLANDSVTSILAANSSALWFGTWHGGVSQYADGSFQTFTTQHGLAGNSVLSILEDREGNLWFGSESAGVTQYDGKNFQRLTDRDGLYNNSAMPIFADHRGNIWIGYEGIPGLTKYTPAKHIAPRVKITQVIADDTYEDPQSLEIRSNVQRVVFRYRGLSHRTRFDNIRYIYRLNGYDAVWSDAVSTREVTYRNLKPGVYTFQVKALDHDLNNSESAKAVITLVLPFYRQPAFLFLTIGTGVVLLVALTIISIGYIKHQKQVAAYRQAALAELKDAKEIQRALLPNAPPEVEGFDIAGLCEPTSEVGGDYYNYFWLNDTKTDLGIVLMDVVGHGVRAALMAALANGMLQAEIRRGQLAEAVMARLHQSLQEVLPKNAFVALAFAVIDIQTKVLTYFNAAVPKPILLRDGEIVELSIQGALPLGARLPEEYTGQAIPLQTGDVLFFFSDGLTEAKNTAGQMYTQPKLEKLAVEFARAERTAQAWLDRIRADIQRFASPNTLDDDLTVVIVSVQ